MKYDEPTVHLSIRVPESVVATLDRMPGSRVEAFVALVAKYGDEFGEQGRMQPDVAPRPAPRPPLLGANSPTPPAGDPHQQLPGHRYEVGPAGGILRCKVCHRPKQITQKPLG